MADIQKYGRTANLFNYVTMATSITGYYLNSDGTTTQNVAWTISDYIPCDGTEFTIRPVGGNAPAICLYDNNKNFIKGQAYNTGGAQTKGTVTITTTQNASYIRFSYQTTLDVPDDITAIMLNEGSTALPFQPYYSWSHSLKKFDGTVWQNATVHEF